MRKASNAEEGGALHIRRRMPIIAAHSGSSSLAGSGNQKLAINPIP